MKLAGVAPASSVTRLAGETPASFIAFDLLALGDDDLTGEPFAHRRAALEQALANAAPPVHVTPITRDEKIARIAPGSFGFLHVYDDEHPEAHHRFMKWSMVQGKISVEEDRTLAPVVRAWHDGHDRKGAG